MYTTEGFGTKFYGECDYQSDRSYIGTNWIILAYVPIVPIYSARHYDATYEFVKLPIHWKQVFLTWGYLLSWIIGVFFLITIMTFSIGINEMLISISQVLLFIFGFVMVFLPTYLRQQAKKQAGFSAEELKLITPEGKRLFFLLFILCICFGLFMLTLPR